MKQFIFICKKAKEENTFIVWDGKYTRWCVFSKDTRFEFYPIEERTPVYINLCKHESIGFEAYGGEICNDCGKRF
jgi:hypothetical protein